MYAILESGAKQYKVSKGDLLKVERLNVKPGAQTVLNKVLLLYDKELHLGAPYLPKAGVVCDVVENERDSKIIVFKYKRRKGYHRKKGHRQQYTLLKVKDIKLEAPKLSASPAKKAAPKAAAKTTTKPTRKKPTKKKS